VNALPRAWGEWVGSARLRSQPEDFVVIEQLGFEPGGEGEHAMLYLEKRELNTQDVVERLARIAQVPPRDIGYSGLKDRNAVTRQWFSVGLAGRVEPDWQALNDHRDIAVLTATRHQRKLKRGVHRSNRFVLQLRELSATQSELTQRLQCVARHGVPNYFGEQRFGNSGQTLTRARRWQQRGGGKLSRKQRSLQLSALRAALFNRLLADRVAAGDWNRVCPGDRCMLAGSRSHFAPTEADTDLDVRCERADLHPGLPLWGRGVEPTARQLGALGEDCVLGEFLEAQGLASDWRATRVLPDDFSWQFCDDGGLRLEFELPPGSYATAVLAELVQYTQGPLGSSE
jgi:tRNA pseudouridine13 synthase